jgi:hypothetical protein
MLEARPLMGGRASFFAFAEWACKRGSVENDHLSGTAVTDGRAGLDRSYSPLLRVGFAKPPRHRDAGALLPHRFSLSPDLHRPGWGDGRYRGSLLFCGTFRRVTAPGR